MFQEPNIMHDITENCYFFLFIDLDKCAWWHTMASDDKGEVGKFCIFFFQFGTPWQI